ncbi:7863_t:CDS:2 [Gigaspora margarita]|uniref:7863_t:CDS:1 n=1 Tax=Gigaspora margarita TaxID=4874 RepID=A0ABN7VFK2_GIGMA|nr:7863_t:CDS:2 [Gigaspora margarita]
MDQNEQSEPGRMDQKKQTEPGRMDQNKQTEPGQTDQNKQTEESQFQKIVLPGPLNRKIPAQVQKALALKMLLNLSSLTQQSELPQRVKGTLMLKFNAAINKFIFCIN